MHQVRRKKSPKKHSWIFISCTKMETLIRSYSRHRAGNGQIIVIQNTLCWGWTSKSQLGFAGLVQKWRTEEIILAERSLDELKIKWWLELAQVHWNLLKTDNYFETRLYSEPKPFILWRRSSRGGERPWQWNDSNRLMNYGFLLLRLFGKRSQWGRRLICWSFFGEGVELAQSELLNEDGTIFYYSKLSQHS